ncbi:unnamed protein product [Leuciscus chuanchicus]
MTKECTSHPKFLQLMSRSLQSHRAPTALHHLRRARDKDTKSRKTESGESMWRQTMRKDREHSGEDSFCPS